MKTKIYLNKIRKVSPLGLLAIGFVTGIVIIYFYFQPQLVYQGKTAKDWSSLATESMVTTKEYSQKLSDLNKKYASMSAALQTFLNAPAPTPIIKYVTQPSSQPSSQPTSVIMDTGMLQVPLWKLNAWDNGTCKTASPADCQ